MGTPAKGTLLPGVFPPVTAEANRPDPGAKGGEMHTITAPSGNCPAPAPALSRTGGRADRSAEYRACAEAGMTQAETARHCGVSHVSVRDWARRHGLTFAEYSRAAARARMKALHADPEFAARRRERLKALHADPRHNPLAALSAEERADYDLLVKKGGLKRADALRSIGRADLAGAAK